MYTVQLYEAYCATEFLLYIFIFKFLGILHNGQWIGKVQNGAKISP